MLVLIEIFEKQFAVLHPMKNSMNANQRNEFYNFKKTEIGLFIDDLCNEFNKLKNIDQDYKDVINSEIEKIKRTTLHLNLFSIIIIDAI